jgi:hypothetical protein
MLTGTIPWRDGEVSFEVRIFCVSRSVLKLYSIAVSRGCERHFACEKNEIRTGCEKDMFYS